jgi:hypothetical protein
VSIRVVSVTALACALTAIVAARAPAAVPGTQASPPPPCLVFVTGYALTTDHHACSVVVSDAVLSCAHDKDSTLDETYDDTDCFLRIGSLLDVDCVSSQGTLSGAPYDATGCGLVVDGTLVLACSSEGGSPGPGQATSRYSNCTSGPVSCSVTMYPDPRYAAPGSVTPDCPPPVRRRT